MEQRGWLVAHLPSDAFRVSRLAVQHPHADIQLMHLGLETQQGSLVHRILLSVRGGARAWNDLRRLLTDEVGAVWQEIPGAEHDALLAFTPETRVGDRTRALLELWPHARVSCLRCRGERADLYILSADPDAAGRLEQELHARFGNVGVEVRQLEVEERTWFRRLLEKPSLMQAMNR